VPAIFSLRSLTASVAAECSACRAWHPHSMAATSHPSAGAHALAAQDAAAGVHSVTSHGCEATSWAPWEVNHMRLSRLVLLGLLVSLGVPQVSDAYGRSGGSRSYYGDRGHTYQLHPYTFRPLRVRPHQPRHGHTPWVYARGKGAAAGARSTAEAGRARTMAAAATTHARFTAAAATTAATAAPTLVVKAHRTMAATTEAQPVVPTTAATSSVPKNSGQGVSRWADGWWATWSWLRPKAAGPTFPGLPGRARDFGGTATCTFREDSTR
jgi:hypothetical protein